MSKINFTNPWMPVLPKTREHMSKLADILMKLPKDHWDFNEIAAFSTGEGAPACGTVGCAAGWAGLNKIAGLTNNLAEVKKRSENFGNDYYHWIEIRHPASQRTGLDAVGYAFKINDAVTQWLFDIGGYQPWGLTYADVTPKMVASRLRYLAKGGIPSHHKYSIWQKEWWNQFKNFDSGSANVEEY